MGVVMKQCIVIVVMIMFGSSTLAMPKGGWYYGICKIHDWRGFARDSSEEAWSDAYAHKELFPEELHQLATERGNR